MYVSQDLAPSTTNNILHVTSGFFHRELQSFIAVVTAEEIAYLIDHIFPPRCLYCKHIFAIKYYPSTWSVLSTEAFRKFLMSWWTFAATRFWGSGVTCQPPDFARVQQLLQHTAEISWDASHLLSDDVSDQLILVSLTLLVFWPDHLIKHDWVDGLQRRACDFQAISIVGRSWWIRMHVKAYTWMWWGFGDMKCPRCKLA